MKRMLFNATQAEELRVAIVDGQKLIDLDIESATKEQRKSNIYKAVITRIEPSLEAAFVDYGSERHGFLPFKEVSRAYFRDGVDSGRVSIKEALKEGQELIVQVDKDERGNKGAALTTYISLAGRYLVLMPNNPRGGGVSRRIEGEERNELRETMDQLEVPAGMSLIARTAGIGRSLEELQWDLNYLLQLWHAIEGAAGLNKGAYLIYQEGSLVIRAIRDYFQPDIGEILIDTDDIYEQARQFMGHVMPGNVARVKRYRDDVPLFSRFQIEHQIETAFSRQVNLPSGGAIVVDHTEALVTVDVNSGRSTRGADIEETALRTNLEAAEEIARQLRLRDLGGLIVIDFIDMESPRAQRDVENHLRDALRHDRARVQTSKISRFGLLELSRQRLRPALAEMSDIPCPRCTGTGHIRSTESAALHILRIIEEEAMKENTGAVHAQIPVDVATFLLNEKRDEIHTIELRHKVTLILIPNIHLETPAHEITRLRHDQLNQEEQMAASYRMVEAPPNEAYRPPSGQTDAPPQRQEAVVKGITPSQPAPVHESTPAAAHPVMPLAPSRPGIVAKIFGLFRGNRQSEPVEPVSEEKSAPATRREKPASTESRSRRGRGQGSRNGERARQEPRDRPEPRKREQKPQAEADVRKESRSRPERAERKTADDASGERRETEKRAPRARRPEPKAAEGQRSQGNEPSSENLTATPPEPGINGAEGTERSEERRGSRRGRRGRGRDNGERRAAAQADEGVSTRIAAQESSSPEAAEVVEPPRMPAAVSEAAEESPFQDAPLPVKLSSPSEVETVAAEPEAAAEEPATPSVVETAAPFNGTEAAETPEVSEAGEAAEINEASESGSTPAPEIALATVAETHAPAPPVVPAPVDLSAALEESGLIMVETQAQRDVAPVEAPQIHLGRKPKPVVAISDEPMVQVETHHRD